MPGYGSPSSDPLTFGLAAGGNMPMNSSGTLPWDYSFSSPRGIGTGTTSPTGAASAANTFNLGSVGDIQKLTESLNNMNQQAQRSALQARIPNNPALEAQSSQNIGADLQGQLSPVEKANLAQAMAERGVSSGIDPSSPNANSAYLRALGTTEHERMLQGQGELSAADARNPIAPVVDSSKYTLTPAQSADINLGYLTEADRMALANQARFQGGGGGGHGGYGGGGPPTSENYGFTTPGEVVGRPTQLGTIGGDVLPNEDYTQQQWLNKMGLYPSSMTPVGSGLPTDYAGTGDVYDQFYGYDPSSWAYSDTQPYQS